MQQNKTKMWMNASSEIKSEDNKQQSRPTYTAAAKLTRYKSNTSHKYNIYGLYNPKQL